VARAQYPIIKQAVRFIAPTSHFIGYYEFVILNDGDYKRASERARPQKKHADCDVARINLRAELSPEFSILFFVQEKDAAAAPGSGIGQ
jgi:hypothetical protein